jgi:hypothetical protein
MIVQIPVMQKYDSDCYGKSCRMLIAYSRNFISPFNMPRFQFSSACGINFIVLGCKLKSNNVTLGNLTVRGTGKLHPRTEQAMVVQKGSRGIAPLFL